MSLFYNSKNGASLNFFRLRFLHEVSITWFYKAKTLKGLQWDTINGLKERLNEELNIGAFNWINPCRVLNSPEWVNVIAGLQQKNSILTSIWKTSLQYI